MIRLDVAAGVNVYPYLAGSDAIGLLSHEVPLIADKAALIYDAALPEFIPDRARAAFTDAGIEVIALPISGGEQAKTMASVERIAGAMAAAGVHRSDVVVGLGGGATTDLAGFVAATYHRGVDYVSIPTTLLGMVDAAVGGKTGVNIAEGKNLLGAFHHPEAVVADVDTLVSLPEAEFRSGMAEILKHGLIADPGLLDLARAQAEALGERDAEVLTALVARAVAVKIAVVADDPTELDRRAFLNYGHTLGHAIETLGHSGAGPARRHGEAVAIGMMFAAHLGVALGGDDLVGVHAQALTNAGLPVEGAGIDFDDVLKQMMRDKKYQHGLRFVVLSQLAMPKVVSGVDPDVVRDCYEVVR